MIRPPMSQGMRAHCSLWVLTAPGGVGIHVRMVYVHTRAHVRHGTRPAAVEWQVGPAARG